MVYTSYCLIDVRLREIASQASAASVSQPPPAPHTPTPQLRASGRGSTTIRGRAGATPSTPFGAATAAALSPFPSWQTRSISKGLQKGGEGVSGRARLREVHTSLLPVDHVTRRWVNDSREAVATSSDRLPELYVNQMISSEVRWTQLGIRVDQQAGGWV